MTKEEHDQIDAEINAIDMDIFTKGVVNGCWGCAPLFRELDIVLDKTTKSDELSQIGEAA